MSEVKNIVKTRLTEKYLNAKRYTDRLKYEMLLMLMHYDEPAWHLAVPGLWLRYIEKLAFEHDMLHLLLYDPGYLLGEIVARGQPAHIMLVRYTSLVTGLAVVETSNLQDEDEKDIVREQIYDMYEKFDPTVLGNLMRLAVGE